MLYSDGDTARMRSEKSRGKGRSEFRRDYGRLLHSPSFRRLQGKTQLFPGHESDFFRNRLTHSLEVAQVAKGIALQLNHDYDCFHDNPIDTDLVELAALAHDLGHPPFGHNGEKALDECMKEYGGFEGNAQTLHVLARVEKKVFRAVNDDDAPECGFTSSGEDRRLGLNLTFRSLASVLKYDKEIPASREANEPLVKGYYTDEAELVSAIKNNVGGSDGTIEAFKTIECQIMDIADDIAYSTYDLEDAMKGGFSHPLALLSSLADNRLIERIHKKVIDAIPSATEQDVFRALQEIFDIWGDETPSPTGLEAFSGSIMVASQGYFRSGFTSELVARAMSGLTLDTSGAAGKGIRFAKVGLSAETRLTIEALKHLNYELMIMSPRLKVVEYRGYELVSTIFRALDNESGHLLLPEDYRKMYLRAKVDAVKKRLICDFVAGMTDRYAVEFYSRLKDSSTSIFKPI